ncbi:hypothetical protein F5883DRAFT_583026 [Diaporthe sp. PMI_573]|nr:hypothetical protein F5883DRAFT_583026 [Diaporthaceae sp. PMI_573]
MAGGVVDTLRSIAPYAPIPLFAENLRTQEELVSAVMTRHSVSSCLTGCIRDFRRLWNVDYLELFGQSHDPRPLAVTSIRHGNVFDLANAAILETAGIVRRHDPLAANPKTANPRRETIVYVSFITPSHPDRPRLSGAKWWAAVSLFILEMAFAIGTAALVVRRGMILGAALLICVGFSQVLIFGLRLLNDPIFGNQAAVQSDRALTARNGAALDVHVIADSWNSSKISVVCGYSSQLHALSNIPVRTTRALALKWCCRALAVVLATQAALLAAITNAEGDERWSSLLWLAFYFLMLLLKKGLHAVVGLEHLLEKQPASVQVMEPLRFSGRRAALVFISMLPVSEKVDRWAWWDVFMPDNDRRRSFHAELESSPLLTEATRWQQQIPDTSMNEKTEGKSSVPANSALEEAAGVIKGPTSRAYLKRYLDVVFPGESPPSATTPSYLC